MAQDSPAQPIMDKRYERQPLAKMLPLATPLSVDFHPTTACNIKCIFCLHSSDHVQYKSLKNQYMPLKLAKKSLENMQDFPDKIKAIHFCGLGEPLLHKEIANMIGYACDLDVAEKVDMNTNGILLSNKTVDALVATQMDFIRISVNGLSSEDFKQYTGAKINFEKYVEQLHYLYENKKNTKVYIKTFSFMVNTEEKKDFFYSTFGAICDSINIEHYRECFLETKGKDVLTTANTNQRGEFLEKIQVCSQPFFKMEIKPNGYCAPCAEAVGPVILGNVQDQSLVDIWNSEKRRKFCRNMLDGLQQASPVCAQCSFVQLCSFQADNLCNDAEKLKALYDK